jgi:uncharacterized repeat protein (TIGR04076 family)
MPVISCLPREAVKRQFGICEDAAIRRKGRESNKKGDMKMKHKVRLTVIDKKLFPELQENFCDDPRSGVCPCYNVGDVFEFYRDGERDDFWHCGLNILVSTSSDPDTIAGGPKMPHCSELWDAISRYIYTGLQGGSIMKGWMARENEMIACCSDGTRPVIFKIERIDYDD